MLPVKALAHGIERTRADVAVNDPKAGETKQKEASTTIFGRNRRKADRISNSRH
jgi:hypothetical protein